MMTARSAFVDGSWKTSVRNASTLVVIAIAFGLTACGAQLGVGTDPSTGVTNVPPPSPSPTPTPTPTPTPPPTASFTSVDASWTANPDSPDGYLVYIGATSGSANSLVATLAKGGSNWNPSSPAVQLSAATVLGIVGSNTQVCVAVRAFNAGGVSSASQVSCTALP